MFSRIVTVFFLAILAFAACVSATGGVTTTTITVTPPAPTSTPLPASQCNTGDLQCCNSTQLASGTTAGLLLGLLGIVLNTLDVLVGITCSPLSIIGINGNSCSAQPVCCSNNNFSGIIALGCTPINLNL